MKITERKYNFNQIILSKCSFIPNPPTFPWLLREIPENSGKYIICLLFVYNLCYYCGFRSVFRRKLYPVLVSLFLSLCFNQVFKKLNGAPSHFVFQIFPFNLTMFSSDSVQNVCFCITVLTYYHICCKLLLNS